MNKLKECIESAKLSDRMVFDDILNRVYSARVDQIEKFGNFMERLNQSMIDGSFGQRAEAFCDVALQKARNLRARGQGELTYGVYCNLREQGYTENQILKRYSEKNKFSIRGYRMQYAIKQKKKASSSSSKR